MYFYMTNSFCIFFFSFVCVCRLCFVSSFFFFFFFFFLFFKGT
ncbi:Mg transporter, putative, partial [Trypanosoma cruzi marinkellei]